MRYLRIAALGLLAATAVPAAAQAQSRSEYREYRQDVAQAQREYRRDLREARRDCRRELRRDRRGRDND